ncbi:DUF7017 domain-containing protein [Caldimonas tepidiphila]|uniref:DUF7017 domain-containing protein n=1 Tax=Caldimonas tepidiphila TaxID=2315841 RepID=UPI000E5AEEBC|nr:hypothetical protein [Caldimonas tepidiphila]
MSRASEISALRKGGRLAEALDLARAAHEASPRDPYLQRAYGWVLYDIVKLDVRDLENQRLPKGEFAHRFGLWMAEYQALDDLDRPGLLYSLMLNLAVKASRAWPGPGFLEFARWWGPQHLRAEDLQPYTPADGKTVASLGLRLHYAIGRGLLEQLDGGDPDLLRWAGKQLLVALDRHPDDLWLNHYRSKWLLAQGEVEQARQCTASVVRRQRRAAWAWALLGQTFESQDPDAAITCFFRSVQLAREPMEVANTRLSLARLLAQQQRFDEAAVQVHRALQFRSDNGFRVSQDLQQLLRSGWFKQRPELEALPREPDVAGEADALLRSLDDRPVLFRTGVVDHQNPQKSLAHVAFPADEGTVLAYGRFPGADQLQPGQLVEVGYVQGQKWPVGFQVSKASEIAGFCRRMSGEVTQRDGQGFGFLVTAEGERVFIPPALLTRFSPARPGEAAECIALLSRDKQGKAGWRALDRT